MRYMTLILVLLLLLFVTSCGRPDAVFTSNEQFWTGVGELDFGFVPSNPPALVYEETPFGISIDMHNQGAHTLSGFMTVSIEEDYMCLVDTSNECSTFNTVSQLSLSVKSDIDDLNAAIVQYNNELAATSDPQQRAQLNTLINTARTNVQRLTASVASTDPYKTKWFSMEGKNIFNSGGGQQVITYPAKAKIAGRQSEKHDVTVIATACYAYTTVWNDEVCIDTDVNKMGVFPGACEAQDITLNSQGAPLAITKIETVMLPTGTGYVRPMFTIYVDNKGQGQIINKEKIEHACTATGLTSRDYNMVFMKQFMLSNEQLLYDFNGLDPATSRELNPGADGDTISCSPNPLILDGDGNDYVRCIVNEGIEWPMFSLDQAPYTASISMQFDYGYTKSKSQEVTVQKILTY